MGGGGAMPPPDKKKNLNAKKLQSGNILNIYQHSDIFHTFSNIVFYFYSFFQYVHYKVNTSLQTGKKGPQIFFPALRAGNAWVHSPGLLPPILNSWIRHWDSHTSRFYDRLSVRVRRFTPRISPSHPWFWQHGFH
jgi:hypothetical protein